jgi:hypothetical protein
MILPRGVEYNYARLLISLYKDDEMSHDIVERIKSTIAEWESQDIACGPPCDMLREASAEIERLRNTIAQLRAVAGAVSVEGHSYADIKKASRANPYEGVMGSSNSNLGSGWDDKA